jgi:glutamate--cysteine ligase
MLKVPHLNTALTGSLLELDQICLNHENHIEVWFQNKWQQYKAPLYGSVDLRNSGFKLTPVDMNLFPAGFNNISPQFTPLAIHAIDAFLSREYPQARKILLIPENHTRNIAYLHNVYALAQIIHQAGIEVAIGSLSPEITEATAVELDHGKELTYYPLVKHGNKLITSSGFEADLIILNNDLSSGKPQILMDIAQPIIPPLNAGWYMRKKTNFFTEYDKVCTEFASLIGIDEWRLNAYFDIATNLDFANRIGLEELASKVDNILDKIRHKYAQYKINEIPYVIVKANNGTYGMGIMAIKSADEILSINRKSRNKMAVIKEGQNVEEVIIQEGVHTIEEINAKVAEPVVYMMDDYVIGGFYRANSHRARDENLNATGASFIPMSCANPCVANSITNIKKHALPNSCPNPFYAYGVVARLALLASSMEIAKYQ